MITIVDEQGSRKYEAADFPLIIGGPDGHFRLPGPEAASCAYLGLSGENVFLQPADGSVISCNGTRLNASHWLRSGDVLGLQAARIRVEGDEGGLCLSLVSDIQATFLAQNSCPTTTPERSAWPSLARRIVLVPKRCAKLLKWVLMQFPRCWNTSPTIAQLL